MGARFSYIGHQQISILYKGCGMSQGIVELETVDAWHAAWAAAWAAQNDVLERMVFASY